MDELTLITKLKSLEASWASLDSWLKFWIFLVVVGVVVELVVILIEYSRELHEFRRGIMQPPDKPSTWLLVFGLLGAGFVAVGVAGEFAIHIRAGKVESDMRDVTFALVAITDAKAEGANERASQNQKEAEGLRKDAEAEHSARVKVEARVSWRHLTGQQKAEIGARLGDFSNKERASFWYRAGDTEAAMFASDLAESLKVAHIVVQPPAGMVRMRESGRFGDPIKPIETGVILQSTKDERSSSLADAIIKELNGHGFDATRQKDPPFDDRPIPQVWVSVEPRPEGPQGEFKLEAKREAKAKNRSNSNAK
jgi:hypothetical protein